MKMLHHHELRNRIILRDVEIIVLSILCALLLVYTGALREFLAYSQKLAIIGNLIAGFFFTSAFTTPPAIVALGELAILGSVWKTALIGSIGAMLGDLIIFRFIRHDLMKDIKFIFRDTVKKSRREKIQLILKWKAIRWSMFALGAIIIASPLPDELGLALMGASPIPTKGFVIVSVLFNFIGIAGIGLVAKAIA